VPRIIMARRRRLLVEYLRKSDALSSICALLRSHQPEILISVLRVVANLALNSGSVAARLFSPQEAPAILALAVHHPHMMVRACVHLPPPPPASPPGASFGSTAWFHR